MDMSDLVSIIIPVYNPGRFFIKCIETCIHQTYTNLEIVLVDDCSTDPYTIELLKKYQAQDSRIRVLRSPQNSGQAYCRNMGIDACKGKYFALIDNDDSFALNFIARTHEEIVRQKTDMVLTDICVYPDDELVANKEDEGIQRDRFDFPVKNYAVISFDNLIKRGLFFNFPLTVYAKLFDTERYRSSGLRFDPSPDMRSVEDEMWAARLQFALKNFSFIPFVGVFRCIRHGSDGTQTLAYCQRSFKSIEQRYKFLKEHNLDVNGILTYGIVRLSANASLGKTYEEKVKLLIDGFEFMERLCGANVSRYPENYVYFYSYNWMNFYNVLFEAEARPNVLWVSLPAIYDCSSPRMRACRRFAEGLVDRGINVTILETIICKDPRAMQNMNLVIKQIHDFNLSNRNLDKNFRQSVIFDFVDSAVHHLLFNTKGLAINKLTVYDHQLIEQYITNLLFKEKPDVAFISGSDPCTLKTAALLKALGIPLIYLAMGNEDGLLPGALPPAPLLSSQVELGGTFKLPTTTPEVCKLFDQCVTFSETLANEWEERKLPMPLTNLGYVGRPTYEHHVSKPGEHVTILSTSLEYGFAIFIKLAMVFRILHPEQKFLIIEDIDFSFTDAISRLHYADGTSIFKDIDLLRDCLTMTNPCNFDKIYDKSKVIVSPTLDKSLLCDTVIDALLNGVPVISTEGNEAAKLVKQAVDYLPIPASTAADHACVPSDEEIQPYVEALERLLALEPQTRRDMALQAYPLSQVQQGWYDLLSKYCSDEEHERVRKYHEKKNKEA